MYWKPSDCTGEGMMLLILLIKKDRFVWIEKITNPSDDDHYSWNRREKPSGKRCPYSIIHDPLFSWFIQITFLCFATSVYWDFFQKKRLLIISLILLLLNTNNRSARWNKANISAYAKFSIIRSLSFLFFFDFNIDTLLL